MKKRISLAVGLSSLLAFAVIASDKSETKERTALKKVHYRVVNIDNFARGKTAAKQVEDYLNKQAIQGYELDTVIDTSSENDTKLLVMKKIL